MSRVHWYDDTYDPRECHTCGLHFDESVNLHLPLEPGRVIAGPEFPELVYDLGPDARPGEPDLVSGL